MVFNCWKNIKHLKIHNLLSAPAHSARNIHQPYVFGSYVTVDYLTLHEHCLLPPVAATKLVLRHVTVCLQAPWSGLCLHRKVVYCMSPAYDQNYPLYPDNAFSLWAETQEQLWWVFFSDEHLDNSLKCSRAPDAIDPVVWAESHKLHT